MGVALAFTFPMKPPTEVRTFGLSRASSTLITHDLMRGWGGCGWGVKNCCSAGRVSCSICSFGAWEVRFWLRRFGRAFVRSFVSSFGRWCARSVGRFSHVWEVALVRSAPFTLYPFPCVLLAWFAIEMWAQWVMPQDRDIDKHGWLLCVDIVPVLRPYLESALVY